jgi:hypothetical protein
LAEIVVERICAAFEVDPATALQDAEALAAELAEHGILRISEQPVTDADSAAGS